MTKTFTFIIFSMVLNVCMGQKANVDKGCIPLKVNFSADSLTSYYWDFKDGTFSSFQNPEHFFTKAGVYTVELKAGKNGIKKGEIIITVFEDPIIDIKYDVSKGCAPLNVNFSPNIKIDPKIKIIGYKWTFGDGNSDTKMNTSYTYTKSGLFTVSLEVITEDNNCIKTKIFFDLIDVKGVNGNFTATADNDCIAPYNYTINNLTTNTPGNSYLWDFGNGTTSTVFNPGKITYSAPGNYKITLKITNSQGCTTQISKFINIGKPIISVKIPDTVCIKQDIGIINLSTGSIFHWVFDNTANDTTSNQTNPYIFYNSSGQKTIKLTIGNNPLCKTDSVFRLFVENPSADFTIDPKISCENPMIVNLEAKNKNYKKYIWNDTILNDGFKTKLSIYEASRDSFYMFFIDTFYVNLLVETNFGCKASRRDTFIHHVPDAYFYSSAPRGCAPLSVDFTEATFTHVPVKRIKWIFGDGTFDESPNNRNITHIYTNPGEYLMKMIIENEAGCIDTSARMWVYVGEQIKPDYKIDKYEICLGESIEVAFLNNDPRIDAYHITTDDGRFNQCWKSKDASHKFKTEPGYFDIKATIEYNGCFTDYTDTKKILVKGAKANIGFRTNCINPLEVLFTNNSINADEIFWSIENTSYQTDTLRHKFKKSGDYEIILSARNIASGCPENFDTETVKIRQIKAVLKTPDSICANVPCKFSGSGSIDVDDECSKGYKWKFSYKRPKETNKSIQIDSFPPGDYWIKLITEDSNGCVDSTEEKHFRAYGMYPNVFISDYDICFPAKVDFKDISFADTTIVERKWFNGSKEISFSEIYNTYFMQKEIFLILKDTIGCLDTFKTQINGYTPVSKIIVSPNKTICKDNPISFFATDFTQKGSSLDFEWEIGNNFKSTLQTFPYLFSSKGIYPVKLTYTEKGTGCKDSVNTEVNVINWPIANYSSDVDSLTNICYPKIINFTNKSIVDGQVSYNWTFRDNSFSTLLNPSEAFPKGTFNVQLIVASPFGCEDTIVKTYKLVGPEGKIIKNKNSLCLGEEITLSIADTSDVSSFIWKFIDGENFQNVSPITKSFNIDSIVSFLPIELIIKSGENQCETIIKDQVAIAPIFAEFSQLDTATCEGQIFLENKSKGASKYLWDFGDSNTSSAENPSHLYSLLGEKTIKLIASNDKCMDTIVKVINLDANNLDIIFPNVFTPNGDMENDYFNIKYDKKTKDKVDVVTFKIYNRWGQLVYNNENINGWDGNFKDTQAPTEVFAYYIELRINNCKTITKKGNITLIR